MRFLPREMRPGVAAGYLLARATDTVADTVDANLDERLALLSMMGAVIDGSASRDAATACFGRLGVLSAAQPHRGEGELLARFPECLALLGSLSLREQALVRTVLESIVQGQSWDLEYFASHQVVSCPEQLEHYTYLVAGCVGEFWTRLGLLVMGNGFSNRPEEELLRWGVHYGMGLQLVNILRDRDEDRTRGRDYLPPPGDALPWLEQAERWLKEGVFYAESLHNGRLRFSTVLPAWLGLDTLALLRSGVPAGKGKARIKRSRVYSRMWQAFVFAWKEAV